MKITYYSRYLSFPIREGLNRLVWDLACEMKRKGFDVEIRYVSKKKRKYRVNGIDIIQDNILNLSFFKTDILHLMIHPNPELIPLLLFSKSKKILMTIADGGFAGGLKKWWTPLICWIIRKRVNKIFVQTKYQKKKLRDLRLGSTIQFPYLKKIKKKDKKSKIPSLLYMGLPAKYKGFLDVINAFKLVQQKVKKVKLIIADSEIVKYTDKEYKNMPKNKDILIKKFVNREEELSKTWIYLYPIRSPQNTMAVPLSLLEADQVGTSFISTRVGGIPEIVRDRFLISPGNINELAEKIIKFLNNPPKINPLKVNIANSKIISDLVKEYVAP